MIHPLSYGLGAYDSPVLFVKSIHIFDLGIIDIEKEFFNMTNDAEKYISH